MTMPKVLARSVDEATPLVKAFVEKILDEKWWGYATLFNLFVCEPALHEVSDREGHTWLQAGWGADVTADKFNALDFRRIEHHYKTRGSNISLDDATIIPMGSKLRVRVWITARVEE